jgi:hypothetical protein
MAVHAIWLELVSMQIDGRNTEIPAYQGNNRESLEILPVSPEFGAKFPRKIPALAPNFPPAKTGNLLVSNRIRGILAPHQESLREP